MIGAKWQTRAGHWASGLFGEFCKQKPKMILFLELWLDTWYLAFFSSKSPGKHLGESSPDSQLSGNGSMFFLLLAPSLFNYYLLWPFISCSMFPHHDSDHLSCFSIPLYQTQPHQLLQASSILAIHLSMNLRPVDGHQQQGGGKPGHPHLDGKYQTIVGMRLNCRTRQACNSPPNH